MADIFLSYSRKDSEMMRRLYNDLQSAGFTVWIDETELVAGTPSWQRAIEQAIDGSRCMIVIMSPDAKQSKWVEIEASIAEDSGHTIIPVLVRGDERNAILFRLRSHEWVDLQQDYQQQVKNKLLPDLHKLLGKPVSVGEQQLKTASKPLLQTKPTHVNAADYVTTGSGLKYHDFVVGNGPAPKQGRQVVVHYTGWLSNGTKFDSSLDRGKPFAFNIGVGKVITGWDEGVLSMKIGGKRQLVIPPNLGYGAQGAGGVIPPNATLVFEVELLEVH